MEKICCDNGTQYTSPKWLEKLTQEGVGLIFSSIRHPHLNIVEGIRRELGIFFRILAERKHSARARYVNKITQIINETYHETTLAIYVLENIFRKKDRTRDIFFMFASIKKDPALVKKALSSENKNNWEMAIREKLDSMNDNNVWKYVDKPLDKRE